MVNFRPREEELRKEENKLSEGSGGMEEVEEVKEM